MSPPEVLEMAVLLLAQQEDTRADMYLLGARRPPLPKHDIVFGNCAALLGATRGERCK